MNKWIRFIINFIVISVMLLIAGVSVWLPGYLMQKDNDAEKNTMMDVPQDYYSGPSEAIIKNASKQLTTEQCLQLILGTWESSVVEIDEADCNITEFGIKNLVIARTENLRIKNLYPIGLTNNYDQWYVWSAKPYRAIDATFQTYAAIFWDVSFVKYDNSESHRFIITESGNILYAEMNVNQQEDSEESSLKDFSPAIKNCSYLFYYFGENYQTLYNTDRVRVTEHGDHTTSYWTLAASQEDLENLSFSTVSGYVSGFTGIKPDEVCILNQSSNYTSTQYFVSYEKTENNYKILLSGDTNK